MSYLTELEKKIHKEQSASIKLYNENMVKHLFHKLWGKAHDNADYDKQEWIKLQVYLNKLDVPV